MNNMIDKIKALVNFEPEYAAEYKLRGKWHRRQTNRPPRVTLASMAEFVNAELAGYHAQIKEGYYSGDSKIAGTRLRREGKDYFGTHIIITDSKGNVCIDHNSAEPYIIELLRPIKSRIC